MRRKHFALISGALVPISRVHFTLFAAWNEVYFGLEDNADKFIVTIFQKPQSPKHYIQWPDKLYLLDAECEIIFEADTGKTIAAKGTLIKYDDNYYHWSKKGKQNV